MSKQSDANTVMVAMLGIGASLVLTKGWLNGASAFIKNKVNGPGGTAPTVNNNASTGGQTPGGSGGSGFPSGPSGGGAGGGGGGSW